MSSGDQSRDGEVDVGLPGEVRSRAKAELLDRLPKLALLVEQVVRGGEDAIACDQGGAPRGGASSGQEQQPDGRIAVERARSASGPSVVAEDRSAARAAAGDEYGGAEDGQCFQGWLPSPVDSVSL